MKLKKIALLVISLLFAFTLLFSAGCVIQEDPIVGKWIHGTVDNIYEFNSDGTCVCYHKWDNNDFSVFSETWVKSGEKYLITDSMFTDEYFVISDDGTQLLHCYTQNEKTISIPYTKYVGNPETIIGTWESDNKLYDIIVTFNKDETYKVVEKGYLTGKTTTEYGEWHYIFYNWFMTEELSFIDEFICVSNDGRKFVGYLNDDIIFKRIS